MFQRSRAAIPASWLHRPTGLDLIWERMVHLAKDPDLVAVSVFAILGLLVSLSLVAFYPMLAAESLVNMPG